MLTPLLVVIVLGAIVVVSARAVVAGRSQPATTRADSDITTPAQRIRSALVLVGLVALLGVVTAGIIAVVVVGGASLVDQALG